MFEDQGDYFIPLLKFLDSQRGRQAETRKVLSCFEESYGSQIPSAHHKLTDSGHVRWQHYLHSCRYRAVQAGLIDSPARGIWRLTEGGHKWLVDHPDATHLVDVKASPQRDEEQENGEVGLERRDQYESFFAQIEAAVRAALPDAVRSLELEYEISGNVWKVYVPSFRGCHYEIRLARKYHEIAIHFESSRQRNEARMRAFEPHLDDLNSKLHMPVRAEAWGRSKNWTRVWIEFPTLTIDPEIAKVYSAVMSKFIVATFPILQVIYGRKPGYDKQRAILNDQIESIRAFLQGYTEHRPTDEQLCDWVNFCYTFEMYAEGRDLFRLVSPDGVNPWYLARTKKVAKICEMRGHA